MAACLDLELKQYDVLNAFVNALLPYEVFMELPPGYQGSARYQGTRRPALVCRLKRALYGLRKSPLLWQKELTKMLSNLGFKPLPHEECCYSRDGLMIFIYVDDMVVTYRREHGS